MESTSPPHTRTSSPCSPHTRRSPRLHENPHSIQEGVYKVTLDCRLKETINQRNTSTTNLGLHVVHGNDWEEIKSKLWVICTSHYQKMAILDGAPPVWSISDTNPTIEMFDNYISLRNRTHVLTPWSSVLAHRYFGKNRN